MDPNEVRRDWAEREGEFSPAYYAHRGPSEVSEAIADALEHYVGTDAAVLEVGCASGRHLECLRRRGFDDLTGIDINADSFEVMADHYPRLAETGTFEVTAIEDAVPDFPAGAFDAVYSVETLQHIHPDDAWVFDELADLTDDLLVTAENEGNGPDRGGDDATVSYVNDEFPLYHRDWKAVFGERGLVELLSEPTKRDTVRVFRVP